MKFFSRLFAETAIQFRGGRARCIKGKQAGALLNELTSFASEFGLVKGEIWINKIGRITFSPEIPKKIHQRLRNILNLYES